MSGTEGLTDPQEPVATRAVSNWNVPNALTTLRIAMVPVLGWVLLHDGGHHLGWRWAAYAVFVLAMATDKIDGDLARKHDLVTDFGKIADPIADKAMTGMALIGLAVIHDFMPAWLWWTATVLVLVREWGVTAARLSVARHVVMPAKQSGKVKTTVQAVALGGFIAPFGLLTGSWAVFGDVVWWISALLLLVAVVLTVTSGVEFTRDVLRHRSERGPAPGPQTGRSGPA
ncbi:MAG: CDP-diacylglycerol--glycerol-3-phosphate 3-phosphatidyltransferase [Marmoricola sp.]|nr:CDP-diacylglycerol--glycerol-3-phosphate 3-phosphatidyltransferase [Marmoricola sp.]